MKIDDNGIIRDMTDEETEQIVLENENIQESEPTAEDRISALEDAVAEMMGVMLNG